MAWSGWDSVRAGALEEPAWVGDQHRRDVRLGYTSAPQGGI
jgi:hypothetical protein